MKDSQQNEVAEADAEHKSKPASDDEDGKREISEATTASIDSISVSASVASAASPVTSTTSTTSSIQPAPPLAPSTSSSIVHRRIRHLRSASYSSSPPSRATAESAANSFSFCKKPMEHRRKVSEFSDFELLPPLDNLLAEMSSLTGSMENDLLPSTPLTEEQMRRADSVLKEDLEGVPINCILEDRVEDDGGPDEPWRYDIRGLMHNTAEQAEEFAIAIWHKLQSWKVIHFSHLPQWLQDNDFLHFGHRPPLPTSECFKSIIRIHTETGNIWTHLLGVVAFFGLAMYFLTRPMAEIQTSEKLVFSCFFAGAIVCLGLSFLFHTLCCHENKSIGRLFAKFDYCGIAFLTVGSYVPWLYYSFYCEWKPLVIYLTTVVILGIGAVVVSTFDFFAGPRFRPLRAGVFIFFGLSGIAPATHYCIVNGWEKSLEEVALAWLIIMGVLYITGALFYAMRIPERFFPGKLDIWFHSHQIFHVFVIAGAFVHYHGVSLMAAYRLHAGECPRDDLDHECVRAVYHRA